jgi:hypothetical protein
MRDVLQLDTHKSDPIAVSSDKLRFHPAEARHVIHKWL